MIATENVIEKEIANVKQVEGRLNVKGSLNVKENVGNAIVEKKEEIHLIIRGIEHQ